MTLTKHAKERLAERFKIKSDSEIFRLKKKFERDFIALERTERQILKTVIWKDQYLQGVFIEDKLITVINRGYTPLHAFHKDNPVIRRAKQRYRNKNRRNARAFH